ncbi:MAG: hypothetical protein LVQ95_01255 [Candidatus Micrarchaeales archaeon]|nr:hypothetical protein [Candidatus Micrarchaeales archaeon]
MLVVTKIEADKAWKSLNEKLATMLEYVNSSEQLDLDTLCVHMDRVIQSIEELQFILLDKMLSKAGSD